MLRRENEYIPSVETIIAEICKVFRVEEKTIRGQQRDRDAVRSRQVAMYLIRKMSNYSYADIARSLAGGTTPPSCTPSSRWSSA